MPLRPAGPCGQSVAMQRLVSPDLNVYTIFDLEALSELVAGLRLDLTLASNLRQLLGFQTVGNDAPSRAPEDRENGRGYIVCALRRLAAAQTCARSGRGQQCDPHFQMLPSRHQSRDAR